jgi:hypothetical protein
MPLNNANIARNTQSKTVQPNKHKPSNLTVIESTSSSDEWQQQKSKTKHTPPSTPNSPLTPSNRQPEIQKQNFSSHLTDIQYYRKKKMTLPIMMQPTHPHMKLLKQIKLIKIKTIYLHQYS